MVVLSAFGRKRLVDAAPASAAAEHGAQPGLVLDHAPAEHESGPIQHIGAGPHGSEGTPHSPPYHQETPPLYWRDAHRTLQPRRTRALLHQFRWSLTVSEDAGVGAVGASPLLLRWRTARRTQPLCCPCCSPALGSTGRLFPHSRALLAPGCSLPARQCGHQPGAHSPPAGVLSGDH